MIFKFIVTRIKDTVELWLIQNKSDGTWTFVNITKGYIGKTRFKDPLKAVDNLDRRLHDGKILAYRQYE